MPTKSKIYLFSLMMISAVLLIGLGPVSVKATPGTDCPNLSDLGYCKSGSFSYYCGIKFNEIGTLTIKFASDNVKIDQDGNAFFNYYDEAIIHGNYIIDSGQNQFIINRTRDLVISAADITLYAGAGSIIANDTNVGTRAKAADDIEIKNSTGARVVLYDASEGKLYVKGKRIINGDSVPASNSFFTGYDAGAEESKAHYCKKAGNKFTLQYGCFIGSTDKTAGEKEVANGCNQCDPNANLFDWSATATGGICTLPNSATGTCSTGTCVCDNNTDCDDGVYCNGTGVCSSESCSQSGNPCVATNRACNETTDVCYGCINDSACSGATPACETSVNTCKQCTAANQTKCNDSLSCTLDICGSNTCSNTLIAGNCLIAGVCYPNGATNPGNACQKCNTNVSTSAWSPKDAGTVCSTTDYCSGAGWYTGKTCNATGSCNQDYSYTTCPDTNGACGAPTCSSGNICSNTGVPEPSGYNTVCNPNNCGTYGGVIQCDGTCSGTAPANITLTNCSACNNCGECNTATATCATPNPTCTAPADKTWNASCQTCSSGIISNVAAGTSCGTNMECNGSGGCVSSCTLPTALVFCNPDNFSSVYVEAKIENNIKYIRAGSGGDVDGSSPDCDTGLILGTSTTCISPGGVIANVFSDSWGAYVSGNIGYHCRNSASWSCGASTSCVVNVGSQCDVDCKFSGSVSCDGTCVNLINKPSGTSCGTNMECNGSGSCVSTCTSSGTCNNHGSCTATGTCICDTGYTGSSCSSCATGYSGYPNCVAGACTPVCDSSKICGNAYYGADGCGGTCQAGSGCTTPTTLGIAVAASGGGGRGSGTITSSPAGINCTDNNIGTCAYWFPVNTYVTLTATPGPGFALFDWNTIGADGGPAHYNNGCVGVTTNTCTIYLSVDKYPGKGAIPVFDLPGSTCVPHCGLTNSHCSGEAYLNSCNTDYCYGTGNCTPSSSCPFLYAWDGQKYNYLTDIKGQNIGFPADHPRAKKAKYFYPQEVVMNDIKSDNGVYKIKLRETINEADYIDEIKLLLVDHPKGYEIISSTADDSLTFVNAKPESILYTIKDPKTAISAVDSNGKDVRKNISQVDNNTAYDYNNQNYYIDLDFGKINSDYAKLVIDGWSIYQINRAKYDTIQPYVEIINQEGRWEEVKKFGWPAGDLKTMVVDLSGKFKASNHKIRMHLGYSITAAPLFDQIRLDDSAPVNVTVHEVYSKSAELYHAGRADSKYSSLNNRITADDSSLADSQADYFYGNFTKYGSVKPLLEKQDDMFVIMRHGDGLDLSFQDAVGLKAGDERTPILYSDLYYKIQYQDAGGKYKKQISKSIYPLPFHAMSQYIYDESTEHYPNDQAYQDYLKEWNTRVCEEGKECYDTTSPAPKPTPKSDKKILAIAIFITVLIISIGAGIVVEVRRRRKAKTWLGRIKKFLRLK